MATEDPGLLKQLLEGAGAVAAALCAAIWGDSKRRVAKLEREVEAKADAKQFAHCSKHIEKLYQNAEGDRRLVRDLHDKAMDAIGASERRILEAIHAQFPGRN